MATGDAIFFLALALIPSILTAAMFVSKQVMLGMAAVIFWAIFGSYSISSSTAVWDTFFLLGFASLLGMTFLCAYGGYSWSVSKRGQVVEGESDSVDDTEGEKYYGENKGDGEMRDLPKENTEKPRPARQHSEVSRATRELRDRAARRRSSLRKINKDW